MAQGSPSDGSRAALGRSAGPPAASTGPVGGPHSFPREVSARPRIEAFSRGLRPDSWHEAFAQVKLDPTSFCLTPDPLLRRSSIRGIKDLTFLGRPAEKLLEGAVRHRAVFTIVQNEPVFLPLWLRHYSRYFEPRDVYVLDHDSTDGSTEADDTRYNLLHVHRDETFDHDWLKATVSAFQAFLLHSYENVLFAEADEFVLALPDTYSGLDEYIERFQDDVARCTGFDVVHHVKEEAALRFDEPILEQRKYWCPSRLYCKPLLSKVPLRWTAGFHDQGHDLERRKARRRRLRRLRRGARRLVSGRVRGGDRRPRDLEPAPDPDLLLLHLHRVDYGYCLTRHRSKAAQKWSRRDVQSGRGRQSRIVEPDQFEEWFYRGSNEGERLLIPESLKTLL